MTLRIMLIGLVASLGYEPSSDPDFSRWAQAGVAWVRARVHNQSEPAVEAKLDLLGLTDCHQVEAEIKEPTCDRDVDAAFEAASEGIVADLVADLHDSHRADETGVILTFDLPVSTGLPEGEEAACVVSLAVEPTAVEVETPDDEVETIDTPIETIEEGTGKGSEPECRLDDLATAVRLTRDAIQAWTSLMQHTADECPVTN